MNFQLVLVSIALATATLAVPASPTQGQVFQAPIKISSIWKSIGKAAGTDPLTYTMSLKGQDMDGLTEKMYEIAESQGEWLTKDELREYASASDEGRTAIIDYLKAQGIQESDYTFSALGDEVEIRSSVAQASQMLVADFEIFVYSGGSKALRTKEYTVDASIAQYVQNIYPIANFQEIKALNLHKQKVDEIEIQDAGEVQDSAVPKECDIRLVTPQCLRKFYGFSEYVPSKGDPQNVDIAIMQYLNQYTSQNDLTQFLKEYRPDAAGYQVPIINLRGAKNDQSKPGDEAMLDVEIVVAATFPLQATVFTFGNKDREDDFSKTFQHFIKADSQPKVITVSFVGQESDYTQAQAFDTCFHAQKLAALGTTIIFGSGDWGVGTYDKSKTCPPFRMMFPHSCQFITSVGGTQRFSPEEVASPDLSRYTSGGGTSNLFPAPKFQKAALSHYLASPANKAPKGAYNSTGRGSPDVACQGSNTIMLVNGEKYLGGGTSAAAPTFASLIALINDARKKVNKGRLGWINPTLYKPSNAFNDITIGGALACGNKNTGFNATLGYDLGSGLGTPKNFAALREIFGA